MAYALFERIKGLVMEPAGTFQASRDDSPGTVLQYFGILLLFFAIMSALVTAVALSALSMTGMFQGMMFFPGKGFLALVPVIVFANVLIFGFVLSIIAGLWIHFWVLAFGGKNGIGQTLRVFLYGLTPALAFGWIPLAGILFAIWSFILDIIGLRELAGLSPARAFLAMLVAVLIPLVLGLLLFAYFFVPAVQPVMVMRPRMGY